MGFILSVKDKLPQEGPIKWCGTLNLQEDGWDTEPFKLTDVDGKLYGRGATDDKVSKDNKPLIVALQRPSLETKTMGKFKGIFLLLKE